MTSSGYRLWVSADRCVLVRMFDSGLVEISTRSDESCIWGPPIRLTEEKT